ncbi:MAG: hypothetical protein WD737_14965 [Gemmatimonadota bacterium]
MLKKLGLAVLLASVPAACAGNGVATSPEVGDLESLGTDIEIDNRTTSSLRIYALYAGQETRLGRVGALSAETVRIPQGAASTIRLVARPSAGVKTQRRHMSEPVEVFPGHRITWELKASPGVSDVPRFSTVRVFACTDPAC